MLRQIHWLALAIAAMFSLASVCGARTVAIVNVGVVPMNGPQTLKCATVVVASGIISALGPTGTTHIPPNALRVDGTGRFLIPGLVDSHVHLQSSEAVNGAFLDLFIANGVTTILNLYGTPSHLALREKIRKGEIPGPDIYTSGGSVGVPHGGTPSTSPEDIEAAVVAQKRAGYDFIKLHGDLTREAYHRLIEVTRRERIPLVGHAPRNLGVGPMLEERQHAVAHVEEYLYAYLFFGRNPQEPVPDLDSKIRTLAAQTAKAGSRVISTLAVYRGIADQIEDIERVLKRPEVRYLPHEVGAAWGWWPPGNTYVSRFGKDTVPWFRTQHHILEQIAKSFQDAGVPLLAGTDAPTSAVVPGFSMHDELKALVAAGLTPYQALRTATVNPAEFLGYRSKGGTIEAGKRADLVLLEGNPLDDISRTSDIAGVLLRGKWIPRAVIKEMLEKGVRSRGGK